MAVGQTVDMQTLKKSLRAFEFHEVDYVYEPGQFAVRGSIVDVYSYSCEWPYRIDFFGDEVDTIRTFDVQDQLSKEHKKQVQIVPKLSEMKEDRVPFLQLLPSTALLLSLIHI